VPAATVVGFHRVFVLRTDRLLSEPLAALLLVSALAALAWALGAERPPGRRLMLAGALFGALVLTRANFILAPIVVAALLGLLIARRHGARSALVAVGAFAVPAVLVVAPWCLYASHREGRLVPVATGGGSSLFIGTFLPGHGSTYGAKRALAGQVWRRHPGLRAIPAVKLRAKLVLDMVAARHPGLSRDAALSLEARRNVARYGRGRPAAFAGLLLSKLPRMWWVYSEGLRTREPAAAAALIACCWCSACSSSVPVSP
jgi:4-amino-4-deoxy-L-arabinose transferase-like glycosyltransferase